MYVFYLTEGKGQRSF